MLHQVYICGGFITEEPLTSAECYNPDTNQWTLIAPMGSPRTAAGVIGFSGQLYVVRGARDTETHIHGCWLLLSCWILIFCLRWLMLI